MLQKILDLIRGRPPGSKERKKKMVWKNNQRIQTGRVHQENPFIRHEQKMVRKKPKVFRFGYLNIEGDLYVLSAGLKSSNNNSSRQNFPKNQITLKANFCSNILSSSKMTHRRVNYNRDYNICILCSSYRTVVVHPMSQYLL